MLAPRSSLALVCGVLVLGTASVRSAPITIADSYVGGNPTHRFWRGRDVIGRRRWFDIDRLEVDVVAGDLVVAVHSAYLDNIGKYHTRLGDLFLSTDGWSPTGPAPYVGDSALDGESWEYALQIEDWEPGKMSGTANLYSTADGTVNLSSAPRGYIYRADQEVWFEPDSGASPLASGSWEIELGRGNDHVLSFSVPYGSELADRELGLHWAISCGNDVIEGAYTSPPVPEPATFFLLGTGGLILLLRERRGRSLPHSRLRVARARLEERARAMREAAGKGTRD